MENEKLKGGDIKLAKVRKSPVPADPKRIWEGALKLPLAERVEIRNGLTKSIEEELAKMEENFNAAKKLITSQQ